MLCKYSSSIREQGASPSTNSGQAIRFQVLQGKSGLSGLKVSGLKKLFGVA
jgi:hypothetical protein